MTYKHAQEMEQNGYGYESNACVPRGLDRLLRKMIVPKECYDLAITSEHEEKSDFPAQIARTVFGTSVQPFPILVGGESLVLFEGDVPETLDAHDLQDWEDVMSISKDHGLVVLLGTEQDHVDPFAALPNGNWASWEFGEQEVELEGPKFDDMLANLAEDCGGLTAAEIWHNELHVYEGGVRRIMLFPPEPEF